MNPKPRVRVNGRFIKKIKIQKEIPVIEGGSDPNASLHHMDVNQEFKNVVAPLVRLIDSINYRRRVNISFPATMKRLHILTRAINKEAFFEESSSKVGEFLG